MVLLGEPRKKSPVTTPGIDPGTSRLVAQFLNHYATPGPSLSLYIYIYILYIYIKQDQHQTKYSHHKTKYIGKQVGTNLPISVMQIYTQCFTTRACHLQTCEQNYYFIRNNETIKASNLCSLHDTVKFPSPMAVSSVAVWYVTQRGTRGAKIMVMK